MSVNNILVLGGTGFVGRTLLEILVARHCKVCVPTRRLARARPLLVLPTVELVQADVYQPDQLRRLLLGRDAVINLVGILHDTRAPLAGRPYGPGFAAAHVELPRALVAACRETGVRRLLQVSALGAATDAPSGYLRSKGDGEAAIGAAADLDWTILQPSVVFGSDDTFLNLFAALAAVLPVLFIGGAGARLQPVWVQDLAQAIVNVLDERSAHGCTFEVCGPTVYTLRELVAYAARAAGHPRPVVGLPPTLANMMATVFELAPGPTLLSRDNLASLRVDSVASQQPYRPAPVLGIQPVPLEPEASLYLSRLHPRTRYGGFRARAGR